MNPLVKQNLLISESIKNNPISGKDAKTIVMLKGDSENQAKKGSVLKEDVAKKYSSYFQSILHHNNGYFAQVNQIIVTYFYGVFFSS